jgi:long-chain acyl-CoA synthetase
LGDEAKKAVLNGEKDAIENELTEHLAKVNKTLDEHERLQFIAVVNEEWLPENGFVTPTNKIKRSRIEEEHDPFLEEWYASKKKVIWYKW